MSETRAERLSHLSPMEFGIQRFNNVNVKSPISPVTQAAFLALDFQASGVHQPQEVLSLLLASEDAINRIVDAGTDAHSKSKRPEAKTMVPLPREEVIKRLLKVFSFAEQMMHLPAHILSEVQQLHEKAYVTGPSVVDPEERIKSLLNRLLRQHGMEEINLHVPKAGKPGLEPE